ncbi:MAG: hypothetical protein VYA46_05790, partial [Verrucomicrobiota bacterium]|nr:hypothetical protein [Verrucomicrobiota bacterium]
RNSSPAPEGLTLIVPPRTSGSRYGGFCCRTPVEGVEGGKAEGEELRERVEKERDREEDAALDPRLELQGDDPGPQELNPEGPFSGLSPELEPDLLRGWIDKLRILRGIRFHRRLEDGVPRMTLRIRVER